MDATVVIPLALAALLVIAGLAGLFVPAMPAAPLLYCGLLLGAWAEDFHYVGFWTLAVLLVLTIPTYVADVESKPPGTRQFAASWRAAIGAVIGLAIGLYHGQAGILIGPFVGALLAELTVRRNMFGNIQSEFGEYIGKVLGTIAKVALAIAMIGIFLFKRLL